MSIKKNFIYSSALTASNYIFPLVVFPYTSKVLGVANIGLCNYIDSISNYFIILSMMGISTVGIREIAKVADRPAELNKAFSSLFFLNALNTIFIIALFCGVVIFIPDLLNEKKLLLMGGIKILFNLFLIEWFYSGIENFRYIAIRNFVVKLIYIISIFLFVRQKEDYVIYYCLSISIIALSAVINWTFKQKFVTLVKDINVKKYAKSFYTAGVYFILTSVYISFNTAYLGYFTNKVEVGYYTTATKIYGIFLALFTAFSGVMLPRLSALMSNGEAKKVEELIEKSFEILYSLSLPLIFFTVALAPEIITLVGGKEFAGAIMPMRIIIPLLIVVGVAQILVYQILVPLKKDKIVLANSVVGAVVGLVVNILAVPVYKSAGSAMAMFTAEIIVLFCAVYYVYYHLNIQIPIKKLLIYLVLSIPYAVICLVVKMYSVDVLLILLFSTFFSLLYFIVSQVIVLKSYIALSALNYVRRKFNYNV